MGNARYSDSEIQYVVSELDKGTDPNDIAKQCKARFGTERTGRTVSLIKYYQKDKLGQTSQPPQEKVAPTPTIKVEDLPPLQFNEVTDTALNDFIPKETEPNYLERPKLLGQIEAIMRLPIEKRKPIFLLGDTATGKTSTPKYIAYKYKLPCLLIQIDRSLNFNELLYKIDFVNATAKYEPALLVRFLQQPCVIVLDELPSAEPEIFFKLHELLQERRIFVKELGKVFHQHPQCYIFATGNFKNALYVGNNKINEALNSRFMTKVVDDFTDDELAKIIELDNTPLKKQLIQFYRGVQDIIRRQNRKYVISLRNLQNIVNLYKNNLSLGQALQWGFMDSILVNNGTEDRNAVWTYAITAFKDYDIEVDELPQVHNENQE